MSPRQPPGDDTLRGVRGAAASGNPVTARWRGEVDLGRLFWREMWLVGSLLNLATGILALWLLAGGGSAAVAVAVHFSMLPLNLFLVGAVWRGATGKPALRAAALLWMLLVTLV